MEMEGFDAAALFFRARVARGVDEVRDLVSDRCVNERLKDRRQLMLPGAGLDVESSLDLA